MQNPLEKIITLIGKGQPKSLADYAASLASVTDAYKADLTNPNATAILELAGKYAQPKNLVQCGEALKQIHFAASERASIAKRGAEKAVAAKFAYKASAPKETAAKRPTARSSCLRPSTPRPSPILPRASRRGVAIIYITHKFEELGRVGDDVTVMRDGRVVGEAREPTLAHAGGPLR